MTRLFLLAFALLLQDLASLGTINGRVLSPDGAPVVNIRVTTQAVDADAGAANNPALSRSAQTDSSGSYRIIGIPAGRYYVAAGPLSTPTYLPGTTTRANAEIVTVTSGSNKNGADIKDFAGRTRFSIRGRFVPPPQAPGTTLITNVSGRYAQAEVATDGSFELSELPMGSRTLELRLPTGRTASIGNVRVEDDIKGLVILGGRVGMDDGSPVPVAPGISAMAVAAEAYVPTPGRPNPLVTAQSVIQPDGSFTLVLPEGEHRIRIRNVPFEYSVRSIAAGNIDLTNAPLTVSSTANISEIRGTMAKAAVAGVKVSGRITGLPSSIVSTANIHLVSGDAISKGGVTSAKADGTFEFPRVPPGIYYLLVQDIREGGPQTAVIAPRIWMVQVGGEDLHDIEFPGFIIPGFLDGGLGLGRLDPLPRVFGRVTVIDENATAQTIPAGLMIRTTGSSPSLTSVRGDGTFTMAAAYGDRRIAFSALPPGYTIQSMTSGATDLINTPLHLDATSPPPEEVRITMVLNRRDAAEGRSRIVNATISGRLLNRNGTPAANVQVHAALSQISPAVVSTVTDSEGNYRLENVPPGQYIVIVGPNGLSTMPSRIVVPRGAQVVSSDPAYQVSVGYGMNLDIGPAIAALDLQLPLQNRSSTLFRLQTIR